MDVNVDVYERGAGSTFTRVSRFAAGENVRTINVLYGAMHYDCLIVGPAVGAVGGVWYFGQVVTLKEKSKAMRLDRQGQLQQHVV